jgi:hypothetical protein
MQVANLPKRIQQLQNCHKQKILLHFFSDWVAEIHRLWGLRITATDKGKIKQTQRIKQILEM